MIWLWYEPRYDDENTIIFLDVSDSTITVVIISIADFVKNRKTFFFYLPIERKNYFIFAVLKRLIICFIKSKRCICIIHFVKFKRTISIAFNRNRWVFLLVYLNKRYRRLKRYFLNGRWRWGPFSRDWMNYLNWSYEHLFWRNLRFHCVNINSLTVMWFSQHVSRNYMISKVIWIEIENIYIGKKI